MIYIAKAHPNPGDFIQLAGSIFYMYGPMKNLTRLHNQLTQARAASERVFELLATQNSIPEPVAPKLLHADKADIVFDNVNFSFGDKAVLQNINLTKIKAGQSSRARWCQPVPAKRRSPICFCVSTTLRTAPSRSVAWTCAKSARSICATRSPLSRRKTSSSTTPSAGTSNSARLGAKERRYHCRRQARPRPGIHPAPAQRF